MSTAAEIIAKATEIANYVQTHSDYLSMTKHDVAIETARLICEDPSVREVVLGIAMAGSDHVHLARQADGTVTVTPMRPVRVMSGHIVASTATAGVYDVLGGDPEQDGALWVDEVSS